MNFLKDNIENVKNPSEKVLFLSTICKIISDKAIVQVVLDRHINSIEN